jgi:hypothetical protein
MTPFQSTCAILFAILAYLILTDKNVADYLTLVFKIAKLNIDRTLWMIRLHPKNPITNLMMRWKYDRIARELQEEMERSTD